MLSPRLASIVDALPLRPGMRVVEIGCGPGGAAREIARRVAPDGHVLAIDRSPTAIRQVRELGGELLESGLLSVRQASAEDLELEPDELPYDLALAVRVGAFDGRHPRAGEEALRRLAGVLVPGALLYTDGGDPLREIPVSAT